MSLSRERKTDSYKIKPNIRSGLNSMMIRISVHKQAAFFCNSQYVYPNLIINYASLHLCASAPFHLYQVVSYHTENHMTRNLPLSISAEKETIQNDRENEVYKDVVISFIKYDHFPYLSIIFSFVNRNLF